MRETTALGAASAAGFAIDVWKGFEELKDINRADRMVFEPEIPKEQSDNMYGRWTKAVEMSKGWLDASEK